MRQVMPHRNNMCMRRSKGKRFFGAEHGDPEMCGEFATRISLPQILAPL